MKTRRSGILLHLTSLPSPYGIGDLGPGAYRFADFLAYAGQSIWQILPLNPTSSTGGNSPYSSFSAFAGNPLLISPERLLAEGFLMPSDIEDPPSFCEERVEYDAVSAYKTDLLRKAFRMFSQGGRLDPDFSEFCHRNACWLDDYALFSAIKEHFGGISWSAWPPGLKERTEPTLHEWKERLAGGILAEKFYQYLFFRQWSALKCYCNRKSIQLLGDLPIYVSFDSVDVWSHPGLFQLDEEQRPAFVAGVPPDYFSPTGQLWGNPVYRWEALKQSGYDWWVRRFDHNLRLFDAIRLDHFRGFVGYWAVPSSETTAINGRWEPAPACDFFTTLFKRFPYLPVIAEDLGVITPDVREIMAQFGFPGMKVLQFAFSGDISVNPYAPHNHTGNALVYTGTHDNNTTRGWFGKDLDEKGRDGLSRYLGKQAVAAEIHRDLIRLAMMSVCATAIIPMQDVLGLGEDARMNVPAVAHGNWEWRFLSAELSPRLARGLASMTRLYGRA
jgi:4-alpha-glucanotransferase